MGIGDSKGDSPKKIAELFLNKFPEIAAEGRGKDKDYAEWYRKTIEASGQSSLPHGNIANLGII